jgi:hypothetical protein
MLSSIILSEAKDVSGCGKVVSLSERELVPPAAKAELKQCSYRSGEPLRHPKAEATLTFSAACLQSAGERHYRASLLCFIS